MARISDDLLETAEYIIKELNFDDSNETLDIIQKWLVNNANIYEIVHEKDKIVKRFKQSMNE